MDDDLTFGTSAWGTSDDITPLPLRTVSLIPTSSDLQQDSDPFDDFNGPTEKNPNVADDDFGDFGDFGETEIVNSTGFEDDIGFGEAPVAGPSSHREWHPLKLDPLPLRSELAEQVNEILEPIWGYGHTSKNLTDEGIREVEGISQILVTSESRDLYKMLIESPPSTKPPNWTRSRIRRQHLITLGLPINLDEVLPRTNGKAMPPLQISTRPMSAPPGPRNALSHNNVPRSSINNSRAGTPISRRPSPPSHFGPKPELDFAKIDKLLELDPGMLNIQPLSTLERHLAELRTQTASASTLLTHLLQTRESLQQDNETYNGLIAELVGEAQKIKSGKPRASASRKGSVMN
ncbi:hypothetical protein L208DRAFT_1421129 [Tricholoma matsutake]|nr:hypothetical protein L208DRAFT_1421129 [Tricholoma matsutake 945]